MRFSERNFWHVACSNREQRLLTKTGAPESVELPPDNSPERQDTVPSDFDVGNIQSPSNSARQSSRSQQEALANQVEQTATIIEPEYTQVASDVDVFLTTNRVFPEAFEDQRQDRLEKFEETVAGDALLTTLLERPRSIFRFFRRESDDFSKNTYAVNAADRTILMLRNRLSALQGVQKISSDEGRGQSVEELRDDLQYRIRRAEKARDEAQEELDEYAEDKAKVDQADSRVRSALLASNQDPVQIDRTIIAIALGRQGVGNLPRTAQSAALLIAGKSDVSRSFIRDYYRARIFSTSGLESTSTLSMMHELRAKPIGSPILIRTEDGVLSLMKRSGEMSDSIVTADGVDLSNVRIDTTSNRIQLGQGPWQPLDVSDRITNDPRAPAFSVPSIPSTSSEQEPQG